MLLAVCQHVDETGEVFLVYPDGTIKPTKVDDFLAMSARDLAGTLIQGTKERAVQASFRVRGIECGQTVLRN